MSGMRCSFCNKDQVDVKRLITGPDGVAICDECVLIGQDIVAGKFDYPSANKCSAIPLNVEPVARPKKRKGKTR